MSNTTSGAVAAAPEPCRAVPFFRPQIGPEEIAEMTRVVESGWLTSGPMVQRFEREFAQAVGARFAVALNSCTAALHLAVEALGLRAGQAVLVPTMTFAATAEVVRYQGAYPVLVDCEEDTCNLSLVDAAAKIHALRNGLLPNVPAGSPVVGIIPVHVGGLMLDVDAVRQFARDHSLWIVEDAAHAFPAAWRRSGQNSWQRCGQGTADVTCFSFYANKTITTGEGGMAVCDDEAIAARIRMMALHGLSRDAWDRYTSRGPWDYRIVAPGFKYNLADPLAALGVHQLAKAEQFRARREELAREYTTALAVPQLDLPPTPADRVHSWHLYPIRLRLDRLEISRNEFIEQLREHAIGCSVHWRPLHLHSYYQRTFACDASLYPVASSTWERMVSLPLFSAMKAEDIYYVIETIHAICARNAI